MHAEACSYNGSSACLVLALSNDMAGMQSSRPGLLLRANLDHSGHKMHAEEFTCIHMAPGVHVTFGGPTFGCITAAVCMQPCLHAAPRHSTVCVCAQMVMR